MANREIFVIGASSGGIEALREVVAGLSSELPASIFVVQHVASNSLNYLPNLLERRTSLPVHLAEDQRAFEPGQIYVAPADHHLFIDREQMFLSKGPRENRVRPSVDPLFRSAALSHGPGTIGVVLSGSLDDGTAGLLAVKRAGGIAVVQEPDDALTPDMPQNALDHVEIDHCLPARDIGPLLSRLAGESVADLDPDLTGLRSEVDIMKQTANNIPSAMAIGELVPLSCPDCGGPLWRIEDDVLRFRCHTGHAFTGRTLSSGLADAEEEALWVALRTMEERVRLLRRLAKSDQKRRHDFAANDFQEKADEAEQHVSQLRALLNRV